MSSADYTWGTWPPSPVEAALRADRDRLRDGLTAAIAYAAARDGRCPIGILRKLLTEETP